jgi:hypothetical protein
MKLAIETFEMLKSAYGLECLSRSSALNGSKRSKEGESPYRTINRKAVLQIPEQKIR